MGLVTNNATPSTPPTEHMRLAALLRDSLREIGKGVACRTKTWAKQLALCESVECCGSAARLAGVLEWYCTKVGQRYTPQAWSASGFRQKFHQIEEAMKRDKERNPTTTITEQAEAVAQRASALGWKSPAKEALPLLAQTAVDGYTPLRIKLFEWVDDRANHGHHSFFALRHLRDSLPTPTEYARQYLVEFCHNRTKWDKWNGDVAQLHWRKDCEHLINRVTKILSAYSGGSGRALPKAKEVMGI